MKFQFIEKKLWKTYDEEELSALHIFDDRGVTRKEIMAENNRLNETNLIFVTEFVNFF